MPGDQRTLVYLHIPKCAGTSLRDWLLKNYRTEQVFWHNAEHKLKDQRVADLRTRRLIIGHIRPYHRKLLALEVMYGKQQKVYAASVRNPRDQVASHLNFVLQNPAHPDYFDMPLEQAIATNARFFKRQQNLQCSYFSPLRTFRAARMWMRSRHTIIHSFDDLPRHVDTLAREFGLRNAPLGQQNKSRKSYEHIRENAALVEFVQRHCREDQKLFDHISSGPQL